MKNHGEVFRKIAERHMADADQIEALSSATKAERVMWIDQERADIAESIAGALSLFAHASRAVAGSYELAADYYDEMLDDDD